MIHTEPHPLTGKTITLDGNVSDPVRHMVEPGKEARVEGWWDTLTGSSWNEQLNNFAVYQFILRNYAREVVEKHIVPDDDEVLYVKIDGLGHLIHASELPAE